jgi:hypothetical protein
MTSARMRRYVLWWGISFRSNFNHSTSRLARCLAHSAIPLGWFSPHTLAIKMINRIKASEYRRPRRFRLSFKV